MLGRDLYSYVLAGSRVPAVLANGREIYGGPSPPRTFQIETCMDHRAERSQCIFGEPVNELEALPRCELYAARTRARLFWEAARLLID
ncbi:hypothetical protein GCM10010407_06620 [Rarobacter incanus]